MALLRLDRERGNRPRFEAFERDRLAGFLAIAVSSVLQSRERGIDLGDELALTITRTQLDRTVGFRGSAIGKIGMVLVLGLQVSQRSLRLLDNLLLPGEQFLPEILALALVHEGFFFRRPIDFVLVQNRRAILMRRHCNPLEKRRESPARGASLYRA